MRFRIARKCGTTAAAGHREVALARESRQLVVSRLDRARAYLTASRPGTVTAITRVSATIRPQPEGGKGVGYARPLAEH